MLKLAKSKSFSLLLIPVAALLVASQNVSAQIYKWQDERGVTQYSDKMPAVKSSKATQAEVVNSLQAKDLCTVPQAATRSKASKIAINDLFNSDFLSANLLGVPTTTNKAITSTTATTTSIVKVATTQPAATSTKTTVTATTSTAKPVTTSTSTTSVAATSSTSSTSTQVAAASPSTTAATTTTNTNATTTSGWTKCANEFQSCQFQGKTKKVRYGISGKYLYGTFTNYVGCSNSAFKGDPMPGTTKICETENAGSASTTTTTAPTTTTEWSKCANEFQSCQFQGSTKTVRYGANGKFYSGTFINYVGCSNSAFGGDPAPGVAKVCEVKSTSTSTVVAQNGTTGTTTSSGSTSSGSTTSGSTTSGSTTSGSTTSGSTTSGSTTSGSTTSGSTTSGSTTGTTTTVPNIIQKDLMPAVNVALNMTPVVGLNKLIIAPTTEQPSPYQFSDGGAVRIDCNTSHMGNNDPIVFPNQAGAAHHHTFFGNTSVNEKTTHASLMTSNSTCSGGTMNRSAYWVPSMINTKTNAPIAPVNNVAYYKTGNSAAVTVPPEGLRMIAGNQKATSSDANPLFGHGARFTCNEDYNTHQDHVPNCANGGTMEYLISFPNCWDGKNLDSPNHQDHMTYAVNDSCPASHPVQIPSISFNIHYKVNDVNGTKYWRLASDNYTTDKPGGYSVHGDWMEGWDRTMIKRLVDGCLKAHKDCHGHLTGDGYMFYQ